MAHQDWLEVSAWSAAAPAGLAAAATAAAPAAAAAQTGSRNLQWQSVLPRIRLDCHYPELFVLLQWGEAGHEGLAMGQPAQTAPGWVHLCKCLQAPGQLLERRHTLKQLKLISLKVVNLPRVGSLDTANVIGSSQGTKAAYRCRSSLSKAFLTCSQQT
jgi:hypothetical protein